MADFEDFQQEAPDVIPEDYMPSQTKTPAPKPIKTQDVDAYLKQFEEPTAPQLVAPSVQAFPNVAKTDPAPVAPQNVSDTEIESYLASKEPTIPGVEQPEQAPSDVSDDDVNAYLKQKLGPVTAQELMKQSDFDPVEYATHFEKDSDEYKAALLAQKLKEEQPTNWGKIVSNIPQYAASGLKGAASFFAGLLAVPFYSAKQIGQNIQAELTSDQAKAAELRRKALTNEAESLLALQTSGESLENIGRIAGKYAQELGVKTSGVSESSKRQELDRIFSEDFDKKVQARKEERQLAQGIPLDTGVIAETLYGGVGDVAPSKILGPEALAKAGAAPVNPEYVGMAAGVSDPMNIILAGLPIPKVLGKIPLVGGILEAAPSIAAKGVGKALQAPATLVGKGFGKLGTVGKAVAGAGIGAELPELIAKGIVSPGTVTTGIGLGLTAKVLQKVGRAIEVQAGEAATGIPGVYTTAIEAAQNAGTSALRPTIARAVGNIGTAAITTPVAFAIPNAVLSEGDPEKFVEMSIGASMFGAAGAALHGPGRAMDQRLQGMLMEADGARRFVASPHWNTNQEVISQMTPGEQSAALRFRSLMYRGLGTDVIYMDGDSYAKQHPEAPNSAASTSADGSTIFVNTKLGTSANWHETLHSAFRFLERESQGARVEALKNLTKRALGQDGIDELAEAYKQSMMRAGASEETASKDAGYLLEENLAEISRKIMSGKDPAELALPATVKDKIVNAAVNSAATIFDALGVSQGLQSGNMLFKTKMVRKAAVQIKKLMYEAGQRARQERAKGPTIQQTIDELSAQLGALEIPRPNMPIAQAEEISVKRNEIIKRIKLLQNILKTQATPTAFAAPQQIQKKDEPVIKADADWTVTPDGQGGVKPRVAEEVPPRPSPEAAPVPEAVAPEGTAPAPEGAQPAPEGVSAPKPLPTPEEINSVVEKAKADALAAHRGKKDSKAAKNKAKRAALDELVKLSKDTPGEIKIQVDDNGAEMATLDFDPSNPIHIALANLDPNALPIKGDESVFNFISYMRGKPVYIRYRSAASEAAGEVGLGQAKFDMRTRAAEYAKDPAQGRSQGVVAHKVSIPLFSFQTQNGDILVKAFTADNILSNAQNVLEFIRLHPELNISFPYTNERMLVEDALAYEQNNANGWTGDGKAKIAGMEGAFPKADPNYIPKEIPEDRFYLLNMFMGEPRTGNIGRYEAIMASGQELKGLQKIAYENAIRSRNLAIQNNRKIAATGDTNPIRAELVAAGFDVQANTKSPYENLYPTLIEEIGSKPLELQATDVPTLRPTEFTTSPVEIAGLGNVERRAVMASFMPEEAATPKERAQARKRDRDHMNVRFMPNTEEFKRWVGDAMVVDDARASKPSTLSYKAQYALSNIQTSQEFLKRFPSREQYVGQAKLAYQSNIDYWTGKRAEDTAIADLMLQHIKENGVDGERAKLELEYDSQKANYDKWKQMLDEEGVDPDNPEPNKYPVFETGKPVVAKVFHSTPRGEFYEFDDTLLGTTTGAGSAKLGHFFSGNRQTAEAYHAYEDEPIPMVGYAKLDRYAKQRMLDEVRQSIGKEEYAKEQLDSLRDEDFDLFSRAEEAWSDREFDSLKPKNNQDADFLKRFEKAKTDEETQVTYEDINKYAKAFPDEVAQIGDWIVGKDGGFDVTPINNFTHEVYVRLKNPLVRDFKGDKYREETYREILERAKEQGHDGVILTNTYDGGPKDNIFVVFDTAGNVKNPDSNFTEGVKDVRFMPEGAPDSLGFMSALRKTVEDKLPNRASAHQILATLDPQKSGVRKEEIESIGLPEWLAEKKNVTKEELLEFIDQNRVDIKEVVKSTGNAIAEAGWTDEQFQTAIQAAERRRDFDEAERLTAIQEDLRLGSDANETGNQTKFSQYTLPGGENYKEVLLTLDAKKQMESELKAFRGLMKDKYGEGWTAFMLTSAERRNFDELVTGTKNQFKSSHYDEPNILAHFRQADHTDTEGNKVRLIEEIQSDWHQTGRKNGYDIKLQAPDTTGWSVKVQKGQYGNTAHIYNENGNMVSSRIDVGDASEQQILNDWRKDYAKAQNPNAVPDAPFKKTWHELAFKRALRMAVEDGMDKIAWTTGEQQNERYDLSKRIRRVTWFGTKDNSSGELIAQDHNGDVVLREKSIPADKVADYIGKDVADRLLSQKDYYGERSLSGLDLKVGGQGMKGFYDKMLPDFVRKYVKKWGGKVETTKLKTPGVKGIEGDFTARAAQYRGPQPNWTVYLDRVGEPISDRSPLTAGMTKEQAEAKAAELNSKKTTEVHSVTITPEMRDGVLAGQPMFSPEAQQTPKERAQARKRDRDYMAAVKSGDTETAKKLLDESAKAAGYVESGWHGTTAGPFNVFNTNNTNETGWRGLGAYFGGGEQAAEFGSAKKFYLKLNNTLETTFEDLMNRFNNPVEARKALEAEGYDSLNTDPYAGAIAVFHPNQIKSADPVTYDDNGNVIPLSERFNQKQDDIRFSPESLTEKQQSQVIDALKKLRSKIAEDGDIRIGGRVASVPFSSLVDSLISDAKNEPNSFWDTFNEVASSEEQVVYENRNGNPVYFSKVIKELEKAFNKPSDSNERRNSDESARPKEQANKSVSPEVEAVYQKAVKEGDIKLAQKLVNAVAKAAGYKKLLHHGSATPRFDIPSTPLFLADESSAQSYANLRAEEAGKGFQPEMYRVFANFKRSASEEVVKQVAEELGIPVENDMAFSVLDPNIGGEWSREVIAELKRQGYDSAKILDFAPGSDNYIQSYVAFDPSQLKLSDPITYDDSGNVIPLSERFNPAKEDIRFSPEAAKTPKERAQARKRDRDYMAAVNGDRGNDPIPTSDPAKLPFEAFVYREAKMMGILPNQITEEIRKFVSGVYQYAKTNDPARLMSENPQRDWADRNPKSAEVMQKVLDEVRASTRYKDKVFHGTPSMFTRFDFNRKNSGTSEYGEGFGFASSDRGLARQYAELGSENARNALRELVESEDAYLASEQQKGADKSQDELARYDAAKANYSRIMNEPYTPRVMELYADMHGAIDTGMQDRTFNSWNVINPNLAKQARESGAPGFIAREVNDSPSEYAPTDIYAFSRANQIKSADLATFDNAGNIVPPSKRFNPAKEDIRFSPEAAKTTKEQAEARKAERKAQQLIEDAANRKIFTSAYVKGGLPRRNMELPSEVTKDKNGSIFFKGKEPKDWTPEDFEAFGKGFGVPNLGPLSPVKSVSSGMGDSSVKIPGGLDGQFSYYDLLWLKANPVDVHSISETVHAQLTAKLARTMTPERDPVQHFNGIVFGMLSPNAPLLPNEVGHARLRFGSMDDIKRFAELLPEKPTQSQRRVLNQAIKKVIGFSAEEKGGLGIPVTADLASVAMAARLFLKNPEFFTKPDNVSWSDFVDKLSSQITGLGTKTASFGSVWQDPLNAGISAIDRHMARVFANEMLKNPDLRQRFEGLVVDRFNNNLKEAKKINNQRLAVERNQKMKPKTKEKRLDKLNKQLEDLPDPTAIKAKTLDDVMGQAQIFGEERVKDFVNEAAFAAMGARKGKLNVKGKRNPFAPEYIQKVDFIVEPKDFTVMSDSYREALRINEENAKRLGVAVFPAQWTLWDRIRQRVEPHEAMFPGLEKLPALNDRQLKDAYEANKVAGYMSTPEAGQTWKRSDVESPSSLAYFMPEEAGLTGQMKESPTGLPVSNFSVGALSAEERRRRVRDAAILRKQQRAANATE